MTRYVYKFFDKLEDKTRGALSRMPLLYALIGGIGVILFWRGVWHTADSFLFMSGPISAIIGAVILLMTGIFVSSFVGNNIILSGLRGEKKIAEKNEEELQTEESEIKHIERVLEHVEKDIADIKAKID